MTTFRWPSGFDPLVGFKSLQRELNRLFNLPGAEGYPPVNVFDTDEAYVVEALLPGVGTSEIDLSITGDTLVIKGTKPPIPNTDDEKYIRRERGHGSFNRTVVLPDSVEADNVKATQTSGLLTVTLPKRDRVRSHRVAVEEG